MSIFWVLGSDDLRKAEDGRIELASGISKNGKQTRSWQGLLERAINRIGTTSDRDVPATGESEQRWGDWDVPSFNRATFGSGESLESGGSCSSASTIPGEITGDSPTRSWRPPSFNRFGSKYVRGSTSSCGITAEVFQERASTTGLSRNDSKWLDQPQRKNRGGSGSLRR